MDNLFLLELSDEMLKEIVQHLDTSSRHCWRRSCRSQAKLFLVHAPSHDWLGEVCPYVPSHIKQKDWQGEICVSIPNRSHILALLYQAAWDEHLALLDQHRELYDIHGEVHALPTCEQELLQLILYVASMRGSFLIWQHLQKSILWDSLPRSHLHQCTCIAIGFDRQDFIAKQLKVAPSQVRLLVYNFDECNQKKSYIKCPDPLDMLAKNKLFSVMEMYLNRFFGEAFIPQVPVHSYTMRHNCACLVYEHFEGFKGGHLSRNLPFLIVKTITTTRPLQWLFDHYPAIYGEMTHSYIDNLRGQKDPVVIGLLLDWLYEHDCITLHSGTPFLSLDRPGAIWTWLDKQFSTCDPTILPDWYMMTKLNRVSVFD